MNIPRVYSSDVAFTPSVKAVQARNGSRHAYARMEEKGSWQTRITPDLASFIGAQTSVFLATANAEGQPYIQHRGGPAGFLMVLDEATIGFVDFAGNRQYITAGNLAENPKAQLFLIDYEHRQRVKIWGEARVVDAARLQSAAGARDHLCGFGVGRELLAAHPATLRGGCTRRARSAHCRIGSRARPIARAGTVETFGEMCESSTGQRTWLRSGDEQYGDRATSANGMVRPCSCPASDRSWPGAPKTRSTPCLKHSRPRLP